MPLHSHRQGIGRSASRRLLSLLAAGGAMTSLGLGMGGIGTAAANATPRSHAAPAGTTTPIKHVIVIIGENHSFDNIFATYRPPKGQTVKNLLSEGIVNANGSPGPKAYKALQRTATDTKTYQVDPKKTGTYSTLPRPNTTYILPSCDGGQPLDAADKRFPVLGNDPFQITKYVPYGATYKNCPEPGPWVGDPLHRFYQMWQQNDENRHDQYVWATNTAGDDNGQQPPAQTDQGALSMGFYNVNDGDVPLLDSLAREYAMGDNYHQAQMGGTGVDHYVLGTGDYPYYENGKGAATVPPANEIENPNPLPGHNNSYINDGYSGGTYTDCASPGAPGVAAIDKWLHSQPVKPWNGGDCQPGHYYLLNNYNPAYNANGTLVNVKSSPYTVPPQTTPDIGNELSAHGISWGYFGQGLTANDTQLAAYCNICNPFQYSKSIMTNPKLRANIKGYPEFLSEARAGKLPAVSYVKPDTTYDGHPASSTLPAFEAFVRTTLNAVMSDRKEWASTAVFITMDESGGYYDSGYIEPISFFGDGPRIPMIVVSPWAKHDYISHTYDDHVSILKFIEDNWRLHPLSRRSLDNLPNPVASASRPYVPTNGPAIGNLMDYFNFKAAPDLARPDLGASAIKVNPLG
jgi:acid phosphatase